MTYIHDDVRVSLTNKWDINNIHRLWRDACERSRMRREMIDKYIEKIIARVAPDENGTYNLYTVANSYVVHISIEVCDISGEATHYVGYLRDVDRVVKASLLIEEEVLMAQEFIEVLTVMQSSLHMRLREVLFSEIKEYILLNSSPSTATTNIVRFNIGEHTYLIKESYMLHEDTPEYTWMGEVGDKYFSV
jgi:hypothetical protein